MINRLLLVVLPTSLLILPHVFHLACADSGFYFAKESGAVEIITAILLAVAIAAVLYLLVKLLTVNKQHGTIHYLKLSILWTVIFGLGCVYFLGEEISWGQHLGGWETPDAWKEINDQNETNLHNTSGWLDQIPRTVLTIGIICGGVIFPLLQRRESQGRRGEDFLNHFMPGKNCIWAGVCVVIMEVTLIVAKITDTTLLPNLGGEVKESLIAMFLLVYIADFADRVLNPSNLNDQTPATISPPRVPSSA